MQNAHIRWARGGEAVLLGIGADTVSLRSTIPSPPGSRLDGVLVSGASVRFKIHSSKKQADGEFVLEGRPIDLTRETREVLAALVG